MKAALFPLRFNELFYERAVKRKIILTMTGYPLFDSQPCRLPGNSSTPIATVLFFYPHLCNSVEIG
jgi:hypothetical protein